jgi:opacity protein-like surface antigen
VNYAYAFNNNLSLYGEFGLGLNISKITNLSVEYDDEDYLITQKYNLAAGFAYGLEAGLLIGKKFNIGIRYNGLGSYKFKGTLEVEYNGESEDEDFKFDKKLPINGLALTVGILF